MRFLPAILTLALCGGVSLAAPASTQLLTMVLAGPKVAFEGTQKTTVYSDSGSASSEVLVFGDGRGAIRREYRSGAVAGIVTLQSGGSTWERSSASAWVRLPGGERTDSASAAGRIARNYRVTVGPAARLCGRAVTMIRIDARWPSNPSRHVWLDTLTGILVRDDLLAPDGKPRSTSQFTRLAMRSQPKSRFAVPAVTAQPSAFGPSSFTRHPSEAAMERFCGLPAPHPTYVPAGFTIEMYGMMTTGSGRHMPAVRYSDGLAAFTIFRRGSGGPGGPGGGRGRGGPGGFGMRGPPSNRQQAVVPVTRPQANYILVGDITESELTRVAASLS